MILKSSPHAFSPAGLRDKIPKTHQSFLGFKKNKKNTSVIVYFFFRSHLLSRVYEPYTVIHARVSYQIP